MQGGMLAVDRCAICGGTERQLMFEEPPYSVVRCRCSFVYVTPRLQDDGLREVYGEDYWKSSNPKQKGYADYAAEGPLYLKTYRRRLRLVRRWLRPGVRVLDVGCAAGYFLRALDEQGIRGMGVELSTPIAREAIAALGADRVHNGLLATAPPDRYPPGSFDLITLWDVLEHVPDPRVFLGEVAALLAPGGRLLIETQNVDSRWARWLGRRWHHFKHQEHLYHFNLGTLTRLLEQCGFAVEHHGSGYAGKYVSFGFIAERAGRFGRLASLLAAPLRLLRHCSVYVNPHDELIVVAARA